MDIQLFATDEELQDFPETKTDSTIHDKTPKSNSINLAVSDLPRSHSHLPRIPSRLPERKIRHRSRRDRRCRSRSKNSAVYRQTALTKNTAHRQADTYKYTVDRQPALARRSNAHRQSTQPNDQLEIKQEIQGIGNPIPAAYLSQLVDRPVDLHPPSEAVLGPSEIAPPVARQLEGPSAHTPSARTPSSRGPSARSSGPVVVISPSPARLEHARSNPLTPGTPICPPRHPDRPEPIKLNYNSLER